MERGNDYVIQVKNNQKNLLKRIKHEVISHPPLDTYITKEIRKGREEIRKTTIYNVPPTKLNRDWVGMKRFIKVVNSGKRNGKPYEKEHYYISSKNANSASYFGKGIRAHWGIENKLHWVKDVVLNEDKSRIKNGNLVSNLSLIKSIVINLYRLNGMNSITMATQKYCNRIMESLSLMNSYI